MNRWAGINPLEALAALGIAGVMEARPVSGGMDTLIWRVDTSAGAYALRLFRPDQRGQWAKEIQVMQAIASPGVPVPRIVAHGVWADRPAMVMEWHAGHPVLDDALAHPERIESLGTSMGKLHAHLHAQSAPAAYSDDHEGWLSMTGSNEAELQRRLRQLRLHDGHVLHLDFHPRNVLCDGCEVTAVLDWANTRVGDPRADVARTRSILRYVSAPPDTNPIDFHAARAAIDRAWIDGYTQVAGSLQDMLLFDIWAGVVFLRDMEQYLGRSDFWMSPADLDRVHGIVTGLKRDARLAG